MQKTKKTKKTKLIFLALLVSMCSNQTQENDETKVISLSTTHTEIIQSLGAENTLVGVDAFSEVDFPVEVIDAYTCLLYTSPSPRDVEESRMPSSA